MGVPSGRVRAFRVQRPDRGSVGQCQLRRLLSGESRPEERGGPRRRGDEIAGSDSFDTCWPPGKSHRTGSPTRSRAGRVRARPCSRLARRGTRFPWSDVVFPALRFGCARCKFLRMGVSHVRSPTPARFGRWEFGSCVERMLDGRAHAKQCSLKMAMFPVGKAARRLRRSSGEALGKAPARITRNIALRSMRPNPLLSATGECL